MINCIISYQEIRDVLQDKNGDIVDYVEKHMYEEERKKVITAGCLKCM